MDADHPKHRLCVGEFKGDVVHLRGNQGQGVTTPLFRTSDNCKPSLCTFSCGLFRVCTSSPFGFPLWGRGVWSSSERCAGEYCLDTTHYCDGVLYWSRLRRRQHPSETATASDRHVAHLTC